MEFAFEPRSSYLDMSRTCSNLVEDQFAVGLSQIPLRYPGRRHVADLLARTSSLLAS